VAIGMLWLAACAVPCQAQFSEGQLAGTVRDESGSPVAGAIVRIVEQRTGVVRIMTTSRIGAYSAPDLKPSRYTLQVELAGFVTVLEKGIRVNAGTVVDMDVTLRVAPVAENLARPEEAVTVVGEASLVNTTQSQLGSVVQQEAIESLPLNGRNFLELAFLIAGNAPTANYDPTKSRVVEVSSAGQLGRGGNVSVDGVDNNDDVVGGVLQNFSVDAVQEFQIVTNRYSAEVGRSATSIVNVVTRSGGNDVHGSGAVFFRNDALSARNPLVARTGSFDREQYSAALGGPLKKDKAFWFLSYEHTHEDGAEIAGRRNRATRTIDTFFTPAPFRDHLFLARLDWQLRAADKLFLRFSHQSNDQTNQGSLRRPVADVGNLQVADNRIDAVVAGWTHVFGPTLVNSARAQWSDFRNSIVRIPGAPVPQIWFPSIQTGATFRAPQATTQTRIEIKDDLNWSRGRHALRAGLDFQPKIASEVSFYLFGSGPVIVAEDFATSDRDGNGIVDDFDIPVDVALKDTAPSIPTARIPDNRYLGLYLQDDWRVRPNLTLNAGLRWEMDFRVKNLDLQSPFPPVQKRVAEKDAFGPRVGFNWDPWRNGRQGVRGGFGVYYDRIVLEVPILERLLDGNRLPVAAFAPASLHDPFCEATPCAAAGFPIGRNSLANDLRAPQNRHLSLGFQRQLGRDHALSLDGVYDKGRRSILGVEVNRPRAAEGYRVPAIEDNVVELRSAGRTEYRALLVTLQRRPARGLSFLASYTLSRSKNFSNDDQIPFAVGPDDPLDLEREYSWAATDERHRFVLSGSWAGPFGLKLSPIVTLSSGVPFDIRQSTDFDGDGAADRFPLLPRNAAGRSVDTGAQLNQLIDQFNSDPSYAALRAIRGRGYAHVDPSLDFSHPFRTLDVRISRTLKTRRAGIELLAEIFNVFNTRNVRGFFLASYAGVGDNMESPVFGKPLSTAGGAFGSGGPRALQVGAKVSF
jgi:hypothetical protein